MLILLVNSLLIFLDTTSVIDLNSHIALITLTIGALLVQWRYYKLDSSILFFLSMLFLVLSSLFMLFGIVQIAEKLAVWSFLLMIPAVVAGILQTRDKNRKGLDMKGFLKITRKGIFKYISFFIG